jgi:hypothetical protein
LLLPAGKPTVTATTTALLEAEMCREAGYHSKLAATLNVPEVTV